MIFLGGGSSVHGDVKGKLITPCFDNRYGAVYAGGEFSCTEEIDLQIIFTWNLPFINLEEITGQDQCLDEIAEYFGSSDSALVCILGECEQKQKYLANYIIHQDDNYKYKAWFPTEDLSELDDKYLALGLRLGLKSFSKLTSENSRRDVIKNWFEKHPFGYWHMKM